MATYVLLDVRLHGRFFPNCLTIPFPRKDFVEYPKGFGGDGMQGVR